MFQAMQGSWHVLPLNPPVLLYNSNETILPTVLFPGKEKPKHKSNSWVCCSFSHFLSLLSSIRKNLCGVSELCIPPGRKECTLTCLPFFHELEIRLGVWDQLLLSKAFLRVFFKTR